MYNSCCLCWLHVPPNFKAKVKLRKKETLAPDIFIFINKAWLEFNNSRVTEQCDKQTVLFANAANTGWNLQQQNSTKCPYQNRFYIIRCTWPSKWATKTVEEPGDRASAAALTNNWLGVRSWSSLDAEIILWQLSISSLAYNPALIPVNDKIKQKYLVRKFQFADYPKLCTMQKIEK